MMSHPVFQALHMSDIVGDITTTVTKRPGDRMTNGIEVHRDTDWIAVDLVAHEELRIDMLGHILADPFLRIYNTAEQVVLEDNDGRSGRMRGKSLSPDIPVATTLKQGRSIPSTQAFTARS
jgi:hypothetical protein